MLTMRVGHDTDYFHDAVAKGREGYYSDAVVAGEPPGIWYGRGAEALGLTGEVDADLMKALYTHGLDPRDPATADRETWAHAARFGNAPRNYKKADEIYAGLLDQHPDAGPEERAELRAEAARSARQSVSFYDVVLSASKTHTLLWVGAARGAQDAEAAGDHEAAEEFRHIARMAEESLLVAHRGALDFLAGHASFVRAGHHGGGAGQWLDAPDITAAQFLQHDSREHDPQLHVHGPILNKAAGPDGTVRALDYSLFIQWRPAAGAYAERLGEADLLDKIGVWWEARPDGKAREIAGIDADASRLFSKRTAAITPKLAELLTRFREDTGRTPTNREHAALAEKATAVTRAAKVFGGETRGGQLDRWAAEYDATFGRDIADLAHSAVGRAPATPAVWSERDVITRALAEMEDSRQAWTRADLMLAVSKALPGHLGITRAQVLPLLDGLTDKAQALARHVNPRTGPEGLDRRYYRADGESVFVKPGYERFATPTQLLGEEELRAAAVRRGAPAWTVEDADAIIDRFARGGRVLGADQAEAFRNILTSGAAVEVLCAPAGTGKSFLVGALADTWPLTGTPLTPGGEPPEPGEGPRVFGIAYGQRQADVLAEEGVTTRNIRKWLDGQERLDAGLATADDETFRLRGGDMLVVDEAAAAANPDLVAVHRRCEQSGAKLLLVADHRQLTPVGAGGGLADIAERGLTYELAEVRRFHEPWEGPASLRLRDGDTTVVAKYAKHGRLVDAGTIEQAEQAAARAWLADTLNGRDALIVVGSNQAAARLSNQVRADLVRLGRVEEEGVQLERDGWRGSVAGVGDLVQARRNAWHLEGWAGNPEAPINRQTYRVTHLTPGGGLVVARVGRDADGAEQLAEPITLPPSYVHDQVTLAYASTVHGAHGRTVQANYPVIGPGTDAASSYVQLTRGAETNVAFIVTRASTDLAETGETATTPRRTAADVLADIIRPPERDTTRTALTFGEQSAEEARSTAAHIDPLVTVIGDITAGRTARWLDHLTAAGALSEHHRVSFAADDACTSVEQLLRTAELAGHDPRQVLTDAVTSSPLEGSTSVAQVLHFRVRKALEHQLTPQVHSYADLLPRDLPDADWAGLDALAAAADTRRAELGALLAEQPPQWAREALGPVPADEAARAVWQEKAGWAASYRELAQHTDDADPLGAAPPAGLAEKNAVYRAAHRELDLADYGDEEETASEGRLRSWVAAWEREQNFAPRYVADELEATHDELRQARTDATVWTARAAAEDDPLVRDQLRVAATEAAERAAQLDEQVRDLKFADHIRDLWREDTAMTRDRAERGRVAAGLRGIDLDDPGERVTAPEWLDAAEIAKLAADDNRFIAEDDVADAPVDDYSAGYDDRDVVEALAPDVRDVAQPDPTERADRGDRRRTPTVDESDAALDRAALTALELKQRREYERAAAAYAAELEPEEDERRAELGRWADEDTEPTFGDEAGDEAVMER